MKNLILLLSIILFSACNNNDSKYYCPPDNDPLGNQPYGAVFSINGCKNDVGLIQNFCSNAEEGFSFTYFPNEKILYVKHINSAYNCSPGKISAKFDFTKSSILIDEYQEKAEARCNCLYDIAFELRHIEAANYLITITNPICKLKQEQPMSFYIDLKNNTSGELKIYRGFYPWEEE